MFKNFITIGFRNLKRFKAYTLINGIGLAIGLTVGVLILLFVTDEMGYDKFHAKKDRIYKIVSKGTDGTMETNAWPIAHQLKTLFPEVEEVVYTRRASSGMMVNFEGHRYEQAIFYAGASFFDIFSFDFIEGKPASALTKPFAIVITKDMRQRYFSSGPALGKTLTLGDSIEFEVTGVIENVPGQSHIQFDILASFKSFEKLTDWFSYSEGWGNFNVRNYLLLKPHASINTLQAKAGNLYMDNVGDWLQEMGMEFYVGFVPLKDIYLKSQVPNGFGPKGSIDQVYLVAGIAIFIIILACINFINLTTARSVYRAKEVGLRKIAGSGRAALFWQFLTEAFLLTVFAFILVVLLIDFALPFFNRLMVKNYQITSLLDPGVLAGAFILIVIISLLSGCYPAIVLSGYKPVQVLKGKMQSSREGIKLRRFLVAFQFFISGGLILATLIVLDQLNYMRSRDLGFDKDQILVLDATRVPHNAAHEVFKNTLKTVKQVEEVSYTNALPGRPGWQGQWAYPETMEDGDQVGTEYMAVDENYLKALGLELIAGSNFNLGKPSELEEGLIINETTVREMGWPTPEDALGRYIVSPSKRPEGKVIGVVRDFHGLGLQENIWPQVMDYSSDDFGRYYAVRFTTGNTSDLVQTAHKLWKQYFGDYTFEYYFLGQDFERQYKSEKRLMTVFIVFSLLTIIIALIGLVGLVSFMVVSRTREIGIRKVLGANVAGLAGLLTKEFALLVIIANVLIIPVIWYLGDQWLDNFAYHMEINPVIFIITLLAMLVMAVTAVSFQTIKAAMASPIKTLRNT